MSWIGPKNHEHYSDPTPYEALNRKHHRPKKESVVHKPFKPMVYICSPYAGDVEKNVRNARKYCRYAFERGAIPIAPHLLFPQFLDDNDSGEREEGLFMGIILLNKCKELWVFGDTISAGMKAEIERAKKTKMPIKYIKEV